MTANERPLIECVPNFSEGRDARVIEVIAAAIRGVEGAHLLDIDPGRGTNRTVMTFVGEPGAVMEAALRSARAAVEQIDMRRHRGEHPRMGAIDVLPFVPVRGVTMDEAAEMARRVGRRLGEELDLTVFLYGRAAAIPERADLSLVRAGEYEGLEARLRDPAHRPDFGPSSFNPRSGATAVGARDFLVAYNVNLNTTSTRRANAIAFDVRERGRVRREGDPLTGPVVRDAKGEPAWVPGRLRAVKAIGWYIEEFGIAQISMNLTDISVTPVHVAFEAVRDAARARGVRVTGSELVGMVPLRAMVEAGRHFLRAQKRSLGVPERDLVHIAARSLGLSDVKPFDPDEKIIEYRLARLEKPPPRLVERSVRRFVEASASESPAPGGGSVAALAGALGAAMGTMVANLSAHKRGWDARWEEFSAWAERGQGLCARLLSLVDEDTDAFNALMAAFALPQETPPAVAARSAAIRAATLGAMRVPLRVMEAAVESMDLLRAMAQTGLPGGVSDAGVGAICARGAALAAHLNVRINAAGMTSPPAEAGEILRRAADLEARAVEQERAILAIVGGKIG
jgi:glutamate formiminotransferase/formiminotetrahydrofolate cyclodeaminase